MLPKSTSRSPRRRRGAATVLITVALFVGTGCGSSNSSKSSQPATTTARNSTSSSANAGATTTDPPTTTKPISGADIAFCRAYSALYSIETPEKPENDPDGSKRLAATQGYWTELVDASHVVLAVAPAEIKADVDFAVTKTEVVNARVQSATSIAELDKFFESVSATTAPTTDQEHMKAIAAYAEAKCAGATMDTTPPAAK